MERALETREVQSVEFELTTDGSAHFYEARTMAAGEDEVVSLVRDVTARRNLEKERAALLERTARESQHLQALIDTSPVGIVAIDGPDQHVVLMNREMERLLGFGVPDHARVDEFLRPRVSFRRPDLTLYEFNELPLQRALVRGETTRAEAMLFEFPDGRSFPVLVNATPVWSLTGEVTSAVAAIQDMTPLEELERLRNEFLGMVTHELRTPLTTIKGSAATMLSSRPLSRPKRCASSSRSSTARATASAISSTACSI
jgi:PAS domain-containing protein